MNWKTVMWLSIWTAMDDPAIRRKEHDRTVRTLEDLIEHDTPRKAFWRRCLALYESEALDL
jgi:hypothetical protein